MTKKNILPSVIFTSNGKPLPYYERNKEKNEN